MQETPLPERKALFDKLNDMHLRLRGPGEVLEKFINAANTMFDSRNDTDMFQYRIADLNRDVRALAEELKLAHG